MRGFFAALRMTSKSRFPAGMKTKKRKPRSESKEARTKKRGFARMDNGTKRRGDFKNNELSEDS
jgi:hypothetical protein